MDRRTKYAARVVTIRPATKVVTKLDTSDSNEASHEVPIPPAGNGVATPNEVNHPSRGPSVTNTIAQNIHLVKLPPIEERRSALPSQADSRKNHRDQRGRGRELQENLDDVVQKLWDSHCSVFPFSSTKRFEVTPERRLAGSLNYFSPFQLPAKSVSKRVLPRITARPRFRW